MESTLALAATKVDTLTFVLTAVIILSGALGVVLARNPVHAALMLVQTLFGVAVAFVAQGAHFLAAVQVIVYAGAIVVLFLFVIMLIGVDSEESIEAEPLRNQRPIAVILGVIALAELLLLGRQEWATGAPSVVAPLTGPAANIEQLARVIFTRYLFAFEATSVLLVIAVVAAVALARRAAAEPDLDADIVEASAAEDRLAAEAAQTKPDVTERQSGEPEVTEPQSGEREVAAVGVGRGLADGGEPPASRSGTPGGNAETDPNGPDPAKEGDT
ncbi:MAG TPA: NADH-quinone oxidoreductase subunit J [Acidimicrobiales bacterium]|nr:NADH-quinone oxidoreductase subunit J [Acidimicrobiales bacterium]